MGEGFWYLNLWSSGLQKHIKDPILTLGSDGSQKNQNQNQKNRFLFSTSFYSNVLKWTNTHKFTIQINSSFFKPKEMNFNFHKSGFILVQSTFVIAPPTFHLNYLPLCNLLNVLVLATSLQPPKLTCPCNLHLRINPWLSLKARRFATKTWECVLIASSNHVMLYPKTMHTILFIPLRSLQHGF